MTQPSGVRVPSSDTEGKSPASQNHVGGFVSLAPKGPPAHNTAAIFAGAAASVVYLSRLVRPLYGSTGNADVTIWYSVEYKSLKNLWHAVTSFRREQQEERRRESRLPAHGITRIHWEDERQGSRTEAASLLGASEHGCSFRTLEPFAMDQKILVEGIDEGTAVDAVVRHCESDGSEYIVGAEFLGAESSTDGGERQIEDDETQSEVAEPADQNT